MRRVSAPAIVDPLPYPGIAHILAERAAERRAEREAEAERERYYPGSWREHLNTDAAK